MSTEKLGIYKKIHTIMGKVEKIVKDAEVGFGKNKYKAVTRDNVVSVVRPHLLDEKVIVVTSQVEKGISFAGKYSSGGDKNRFEGLYAVSFIDIEDGSKLTCNFEGHGEGNDDKCPNKASTYAEKMAFIKTFLLESGEEETGQVSPNKITAKQIGIIHGLIETKQANKDEFLQYFGVETLTDISVDHYQRAVDMLQKKKTPAKKAPAKKEAPTIVEEGVTNA